MIRIRRSLISLALLCTLSACQKPQTPVESNKPTPAPTTAPAAAPTTPPPAPTSTAVAPTADSVGVPECDNYLTKYEACINGKVPEAARASLKQSLDQTRGAWKAAAGSPAGKEGLANACKQMYDATKASMSQYGCADF